MAEKINFTKAVLDALPAPETGRVYYYDDRTPGLAIAVMDSGIKTFYVYKRVGTKPVRVRIGRYPDVPPQLARQEATRLLGEIAVGRNPQEERQRTRRESANTKTLQAVWDIYREQHLKRYCTARTAYNAVHFWEPVPWKGYKLSSLTTEEVKRLHRELGESRGPIMANRVVQLLRTLYGYAIEELGYTRANPVRIRKAARGDRRRTGGIVLFPEKGRDRFLQPDEVPAFFKALNAEEDQDFKDLVLLLLYTGARRSNVQAMRWGEVHLDRALWVIPQTKNGDEVKIALSPWALQVLKDRAARCGPGGSGDGWVFPAPRSRSGHVEVPRKKWYALLGQAGLKNLHLHDLRRTLATYQRTTGATLEMIGASLGHRSRAATEIYARVDLSPVRQAVTTATQALLAAAERKTGQEGNGEAQASDSQDAVGRIQDHE